MPLTPIAGVTLEKYAELCASMKETGGDAEKCVAIAAQQGVGRDAWFAAQNGWNARMSNPATAGTVCIAYMPLYQAALARSGPVATATFEEYVVMSAMINCLDKSLDRMYAHFGIDVYKWSQISTYWVDRLIKDPQLGVAFQNAGKAEIQRLEAGQPPSLGRGAAAQQQQAQAQQQAQQATFPQGTQVLVHWSDGNRYPGQVTQFGNGHYLVVFAGGRQEWIPAQFVAKA